MSINVSINYPNKSVERWLSSDCSEHHCQNLAIQWVLDGKFQKPLVYDCDKMWQYYKNVENFKRGRGEILETRSITNEWGDKITWDIHINKDHTECVVDVFVEYEIDKY